MNILALNKQHNASVCLLKDGEIIYHSEEERHSRVKYDAIPYKSLTKALSFLDGPLDYLYTVGLYDNGENAFYDYLIYKTIRQEDYKINNSDDNHHLTHASCGFYNSGFQEAVVIVVDGAGSFVNGKKEIESFFTFKYPADFECIYRRLESEDYFSSGWMYEAVSTHFGFGFLDAGKVMGLSSYGKPNGKQLKFYNDPKTRQPLFDHKPVEDFKERADIAYTLQRTTEQRLVKLIHEAVEKSGCKNVVITGGYALNCVANYHYLDNLPDGVNLYVEPISSDAGTSIGAAKLLHHTLTQDMTIRKQKNLYYGASYEVKNTGQKADYSDVVDLLEKEKIIAMYQGGAESGPRSLGNRTILFNPTIKNGKDIVNRVKGREHFRPFAGTIMAEHLEEWFDTRGLPSSPFMMYAMKTKKPEQISSIVHVDGTCRIQSLTVEENKHFYKLIQEFYNRTGVPILFNTSFNLAGEPIVETPEDAVRTLENSGIDALFFPEQKILITKKGEQK